MSNLPPPPPRRPSTTEGVSRRQRQASGTFGTLGTLVKAMLYTARRVSFTEENKAVQQQIEIPKEPAEITLKFKLLKHNTQQYPDKILRDKALIDFILDKLAQNSQQFGQIQAVAFNSDGTLEIHTRTLQNKTYTEKLMLAALNNFVNPKYASQHRLFSKDSGYSIEKVDFTPTITPPRRPRARSAP